MNILGPLTRSYARVTRSLWSAAPTSITPAAQNAWEERQFRYYATQQPYASPLTMTGGNLSGETWEMRQGYREFAIKEPAAKAALLTKCLAVCKLKGEFSPNDRTDSKDKDAAAWVRDAINAADGGLPGLLFNMLCPSLMDGFSVVEPVYEHMNTRDNRYPGWWYADQYASIDTNYTRFKLDVNRQVIGVQSVAGSQTAVQLDPDDFIIFTHLKLFESPYGISDMRAAVRACMLIESAIRLRHILLTNFSGPFLWSTADTPDKRAVLLKQLEQARANGFIVVPEGTTLQVINLATSAPDQFRQSIEDYRQEIVTAIQGAYLQLLEGDTPGGRGNTETHRGIAEIFVWWLATWAAAVINKQLIPRLVIPQFGNSVGFPRLTLGGIDESAVSAAMGRFKAGLEIGLDNISKRQAMEAGGFEEAADEGDKLKMPQGAAGQGPGQDGGKGGGQNDPFANMFADKNAIHVNGSGKAGAGSVGANFRHGDQSFADLSDFLS